MGSVVLDEQRAPGATLLTLRRRRREIEGWLDGPAKKATLTAIDREIAKQEREAVGRPLQLR